jgi:hypothetical protein
MSETNLNKNKDGTWTINYLDDGIIISINGKTSEEVTIKLKNLLEHASIINGK